MSTTKLTNWLLGALFSTVLLLSGWLVSQWNRTVNTIEGRQQAVEIKLERIDTRQEDVIRRFEGFEAKLDAWYAEQRSKQP